MLRRLNEALPGLLLGILSYGLLIQITGVWFVEDKLRYSTGLWIGIALAAGMAVHMAMVIEEIVNQGKGRAIVTAKSIFRYAVVVMVFFVMMKFQIGNLITAFLGIMGLKAAAYMQPFIHKRILKEDKEVRV